MARKLTVVPEDAKAPVSPRSVKEAAESGDPRALLVSLRTRIASDIDSTNTPPRDLAALSQRILQIAREIAALDALDKGDAIGSSAAVADEEWAAN